MIKKCLILSSLCLLILCSCVKQNENKEAQIIISNGDNLKIEVNEEYQLEVDLINLEGKVKYSSPDLDISELGNINPTKTGEFIVTASLGDVETTINIEVVEDIDYENMYKDINIDDFYQNYTKAYSYDEAVVRTGYYLMSGDIEVPNQKLTYSNRIKEDGKYVRNTTTLFSEDYNTYYVLDTYGNVVNHVYRNCAYITLEEVAAYLMAFGDIPANYVEGKSLKPTYSPWKEYLRLNNTYFSGDTSKYPYEPLLPNISGEGGELDYYEIDLGTTGTDCDPAYLARIYNNGRTIVRGAARLVYVRYDKNGNQVIDPNERYVFYTYNHYNDFEEYLNYEGGWGEMFGNITGGGEISSRENYNPTPYVETLRKDFLND